MEDAARRGAFLGSPRSNLLTVFLVTFLVLFIVALGTVLGLIPLYLSQNKSNRTAYFNNDMVLFTLFPSNTTLTTRSFTTRANSSSFQDPVFYWPICENNLADFSTGRFALAPNDQNLLYASNRFNVTNRAIHLRNSSLTLSDAYYLNTQFTITAFINVRSVQNDSVLIYLRGENEFELIIGLSAIRRSRAYVYMRFNSSLDETVTATNDFSLNKWSHLVVVFNPPFVSIYLDQVLEDVEQFFTLDNVGQARVIVGNLPGIGSNDFQLDDLKFYDYALSRDFIAQDGNNTLASC